MKSVNEQIAEKMGWEVLDPEYNYDDFNGVIGGIELSFNLHNLVAVKALQQRMVDDGWEIEMTVNKSGFIFFAWKGKGGDDNENEEIEFDEGDSATEPAAIVELFKKVYGIREVGHE